MDFDFINKPFSLHLGVAGHVGQASGLLGSIWRLKGLGNETAQAKHRVRVGWLKYPIYRHRGILHPGGFCTVPGSVVSTLDGVGSLYGVVSTL